MKSSSQNFRILFLILVVCSWIQSSDGQAANQQFETANQLYKAKQFDSALVAFEGLIKQGYQSAEVYYNLGNCYYKTKQVGKAIINYERALKLNPDDEDVQHNLKLVNLLTADKIQPVPQVFFVRWWNSLLQLNSAKGWSIFSIVFVWLSLAGFAVYLFITTLRRTGFSFGFIFLLLSLTFLFFSFKQNATEQSLDNAILMIPNTYIKSAPDLQSMDLFIIHEGIKLRVEDKVGDWIKIRLADGKSGWIPVAAIERI